MRQDGYLYRCLSFVYNGIGRFRFEYIYTICNTRRCHALNAVSLGEDLTIVFPGIRVSVDGQCVARGRWWSPTALI